MNELPGPEIKGGILICFYPAGSRGWDKSLAAGRLMFPS